MRETINPIPQGYHVRSCYRCREVFCREVIEKPDLGRLMYQVFDLKREPLHDWQPVKECVIYQKAVNKNEGKTP